MPKFVFSQQFHEFPHNELTDVTISKYSADVSLSFWCEKEFCYRFFVTKKADYSSLSHRQRIVSGIGEWTQEGFFQRVGCIYLILVFRVEIFFRATNTISLKK